MRKAFAADQQRHSARVVTLLVGALTGGLVAIATPASAEPASPFVGGAYDRSISTARPSVGANEQWIEYNRSNYCVYLHQGQSTVWYTCRTSNGKPSTPTILGNYRVYNMRPGPFCMHPPDGTEACGIRYATYWGPGGYAFHEAWWMGGRVNRGISHGCVNMTADGARTVYNFAYVGMRVWVHA